MRALSLIPCVLSVLAMAGSAYAQTPMRVAGNFTANVKHGEIEKPFFEGLADAAGVKLAMNYNPMDVVGVKAADALRLLRGGTFDVMTVQIGMVSRDDPFFEGIDLVGVSPDMASLRKVVEAYREVFDKRLQAKFNAKVLTLWPYGPQVFYCNGPVNSLADLKGLKVRSFTPSMSAMLEDLGATAVTLQASEVYPALQRGVASCGVTSPTSGNTGNWPEVTTNLLTLGVTGSMQGHFINLDSWNKFTKEEQDALEAQFKVLEDQLWQLALDANGDAVACNTGQDSCQNHKKFAMKLVEPSDEDREKLKDVTTRIVFPIWKKTCNAVDPDCTKVWNETAGVAANLTID